MRMRRHDRSFLISCMSRILTAFLIWSMAVVMPPGAWAAELPLGLATGSKEAHMAIDGKQWATLPMSSSPVYTGAMIRTGKGAAAVMLQDGTQLELQSHTLIGLSGSRTAPIIKIAVGRVGFRMSAASHAALVTPSVRYRTNPNGQPENAAIMKVSTSAPSRPDLVGEIVVNPLGGSRLGLQQGAMVVNPVNDPGRHLIKAGQGVYIPQVGTRDPDFNVMLAQALPGAPAPSGLPADAMPVYTQPGSSIGYITADGTFTSAPSITPDLQSPVPDGAIPPDADIPVGATPIFTADLLYAGYLQNDQLVAYIPLGGGAAGGVAGGGAGPSGAEIATGLFVTSAAIGGAIAAGVTAGGNKASPSEP